MELLGDVDQVEGHFDLLGFAECTMGIEIIFGAPDGTPR
jgi:hypothetical protein